MSKMFSVVTLDAPHSLMTKHFVPGSPDGLEELLECVKKVKMKKI